MTLAQARRRRLAAAMTEAGIDALVVYGNAWQGDHLRYAADFGILEGHGIALLRADGTCELYLDSSAEMERAEAETAGVQIRFARDIAHGVAQELDRIANQNLAAAPRRFLPRFLTDETRRYSLSDGTALVDSLLMRKLPLEIECLRRAAVLADEGYAVFREAARPGRRQYELVAEVEAFFRTQGCPDNFMILGSGGVDVRLPSSSGFDLHARTVSGTISTRRPMTSCSS
jgi:Xaa-Pro aminopeptidase